MKRKNILLGALCTLLLTGCGGQSGSRNMISVYYPAADGSGELVTELLENTGRSDMVEDLYNALCTPPENGEKTSAIPSGALLQSWNLEDGILTLDLSGEYSTLSGVEQTLANSCIVLTMCQLEDVSGVVITADGESISGEAPLGADEILLTGGEGDSGEIEARLYFPMEEGGIGYETRSLTVSESLSVSQTLLQALCAGPESDELEAFLPSDPEGITLWTDMNICYVNLTVEWETALEGENGSLQQRLQCITNTLTELEAVDSVQFVMDGAAMEQWADFGGDFPMIPDTSGCTAVNNE